jgi:hypothetical protein
MSATFQNKVFSGSTNGAAVEITGANQVLHTVRGAVTEGFVDRITIQIVNTTASIATITLRTAVAADNLPFTVAANSISDVVEMSLASAEILDVTSSEGTGTYVIGSVLRFLGAQKPD